MSVDLDFLDDDAVLAELSDKVDKLEENLKIGLGCNKPDPPEEVLKVCNKMKGGKRKRKSRKKKKNKKTKRTTKRRKGGGDCAAMTDCGECVTYVKPNGKRCTWNNQADYKYPNKRCRQENIFRSKGWIQPDGDCFTRDDYGRYYGTVKDGKRHGIGTHTSNDGKAVYYGKWKDGKFKKWGDYMNASAPSAEDMPPIQAQVVNMESLPALGRLKTQDVPEYPSWKMEDDDKPRKDACTKTMEALGDCVVSGGRKLRRKTRRKTRRKRHKHIGGAKCKCCDCCKKRKKTKKTRKKRRRRR